MLLYKTPNHRWICEGMDLQEQRHFKTGIEVNQIKNENSLKFRIYI